MVIRICTLRIRGAEALAWRATDDPVEAVGNSSEIPNVAAGDFVRAGDDGKSSRCESTAEKVNTGEQ
ncbi:MAG: hypothetical protein AAF958_00765 [Planctomycetota bacterium]